MEAKDRTIPGPNNNLHQGGLPNLHFQRHRSLHQVQPKMKSTQPFVDPMPFTKFIKMAGQLSTEENTEIKNTKGAIHRDQPHQKALNCGTPKNPWSASGQDQELDVSDQQDRQHSTGTGQVVLRPKAVRTQSHGWNQPDASASETIAESPQVEIPQIPPADLEADWRRPSQDREEEEAEREDKGDGKEMHPNDPADQMMIPKHKSMDEDWGISVKKAFDDTSRTLAPCEIPAEKAVVLPTTISERGYNNFAAILSRHNPKAPRTVVENMTTIFAQSGKMNPEQAEGSYTFEVTALERFGLFVPTCFEPKPPFDGNGTYVYHIIHGTSPKGASTILAEEMIRPGDFDIKRDLAKCQYPSYGF